MPNSFVSTPEPPFDWEKEIYKIMLGNMMPKQARGPWGIGQSVFDLWKMYNKPIIFTAQGGGANSNPFASIASLFGVQ